MKYINKYRIRFWVSALFQALFFWAVFLPTKRVVSIAEFTLQYEVVSKSAEWFLSSAGFPGIYNWILIIYGLLSLPIILFGFGETLKRWPLLLAAITSIVFVVVNTVCTIFVLFVAKEVATFANLTIWFWVYIVLQIIHIVHIFFLMSSIKKK